MIATCKFPKEKMLMTEKYLLNYINTSARTDNGISLDTDIIFQHKKLIREITELKSSQPAKKATNVALIGPDRVGKTSFLKTVSSIDKGLYVSSHWSCTCGEGVIKRTMVL